MDLDAALHHSSDHRKQVLASETCGCFHCLETFPPDEITDWTDDDGEGGRTALCPRCGSDSVIGSRSGIELSPAFLTAMHRRFFQ